MSRQRVVAKESAASSNQQYRITTWPWLAVLAVLLGSLVLMSRQQMKNNDSHNVKVQNGAAISTEQVDIVTGQAGGIGFYVCTHHDDNKSKTASSLPDFSVVLLHGKSFTKENWKTSGILQRFCNYNDENNSKKHSWSVVALDLPVAARRDELQRVLDALVAQQVVVLPLAALVTPSASGLSVVDWVMHGSVAAAAAASPPERGALALYTTRWMPVASPAVLPADADKLALLRNVVQVVAIHGDQDHNGARSSARLGELADARVVEVPGRHPCYLESPDAFVQVVMTAIFE